MTDDERRAAASITWDQLRTGDPDCARLINAVVPILQVIPARSHAQAFAMLFGMLMGEMRQHVPDFNLEDHLEFHAIIARTTYCAHVAEEEAAKVLPPVPEPPKRPATLLHLVPQGDSDGEEVHEQQPSDARPDGESGQTDDTSGS